MREARRLRLIDELRGDLRYGWRQWVRTPSFSLLASAVLVAGIGANAALFRVIEAVMLRWLPVQQPVQLRRIEWTDRESGFVRPCSGRARPDALKELAAWSVSYPVYWHLRDSSKSVSRLIRFSGFTRLNPTIRGHAQLASGELVSGNFTTT